MEDLFWTFRISSIEGTHWSPTLEEITDIKCRPVSNHFCQGTQQHGKYTKPLGSAKFAEKIMFQLLHGIKNINWSNFYQWYTYLGRTFLQPLLLKVCETFLFRQSKKACSILWSVWVFFAFLEKRSTLNRK